MRNVWRRIRHTRPSQCEVTHTTHPRYIPLFVPAIRYNFTHNLLTKEEQIMTITYSIWQGSRLLSIDNVAHEIKAIDHLMDSLNASELGKKVKFSANIQSIKTGE